MKHAFLILTHLSPEKTYNQVARMQAMDNYFFIHWDAKKHIDETDPFYQKLTSLKNITILKNRVNVQWGSFRIVEATLALMKEALKQKDISYLHLLSGECLHVRSMPFIHDFFRQNNGKEFLNNWVMPEKRTEGWGFNRLDKYHFHDYFNPRSDKTKDKIIKLGNSLARKAQRLLKPIGIYRYYSSKLPVVYGGSAWWSLSAKACNYVFEFIKDHPEYYKRFQLTQLPDEMFFHTILLNSPFKEQVQNDNLRLTYFKKDVTVTYAYPLTMEQLDEVSKPGILFARKFSDQSTELISYLEQNVY